MQAEYERRKHDKLRRDLGALVIGALSDPMTTEVMCNPDGRLWLERLGEPMRCIGELAPSRAEAVIKTVASHLKTEVTAAMPMVEGELPPDDYRFAGQLWPVVTGPTFSIRKLAVRVFTLGEYVAQGALTDVHGAVLVDAIRRRRNVLVVGGTGSGKTTFVNALVAEMIRLDRTERLVTIEDKRELQCEAENRVQYVSSDDVPMTALLRTTLRMRPDRILVGEVRGPEALDLLMAWNTGHEGSAATVHANSAEAGLSRLEMLVSMAAQAPRNIAPLIAEAVHVVVHVARTPEGRRVKSVVEVTGLDRNGGYATRRL